MLGSKRDTAAKTCHRKRIFNTAPMMRSRGITPCQLLVRNPKNFLSPSPSIVGVSLPARTDRQITMTEKRAGNPYAEAKYIGSAWKPRPDKKYRRLIYGLTMNV